MNDMSEYYSAPEDYCSWYGLELKRRRLCGEQFESIELKYNAVLTDGTVTKRMSLKEILLRYIDFYRTAMAGSAGEVLDDSALCAVLLEYKKAARARRTL